MDSLYRQVLHERIYGPQLPVPKRAKATIVAVNCLRAGEHCFCTSIGTDVFSTKGHDLALTPMEDIFLVEAATEKGHGLIEGAIDYFTVADKALLQSKENPQAAGGRELSAENGPDQFVGRHGPHLRCRFLD
jgi:hypothetical protein